ncbi:MAG: hypothetical protein U5L96_05325 [Owenweeksia sp.]|nr:hypothetical protein [Owenweeksia sp.]
MPYLVKTPFWLQGQLGIYRQDSSFVNANFEGRVKYLLTSGSFLSGGISYRSSNVLGENTGTRLNSFNTTFYRTRPGAAADQSRSSADCKGYKLTTFGATGSRENDDQKQDQFSYDFFGAYYFKIQRHIIKAGLQSQALFGKDLFLNEVYRIGGLKTRCEVFNEQSIP